MVSIIAMTESIERLLTVKDVMNTLRISRRTLYRMLKSEQIQPVRIGKRTLFDPADVRRLIQQSKPGARPEPRENKKVVSQPPSQARAAKPQRPEEAPQTNQPMPETHDKQGRLL